MSQSLKMPSPLVAWGFILGAGAVIGWLNHIAVTSFGWPPFAYCAGLWFTRAISLDVLYGYIWFGAVAYAAYLVIKKQWQNSILTFCGVALFINAPVLFDQYFRLGGSCHGSVAKAEQQPAPIPPPAIIADPVTPVTPNPTPNAALAPAPAPAAPPPMNILPPAVEKPPQKAAKAAAPKIDPERWYTEAEAMKLLSVSAARMAEIRRAREFEIRTTPALEGGVRMYKGDTLLKERKQPSYALPAIH